LRWHRNGDVVSRRGDFVVQHTVAAQALHEGNHLLMGHRPGRAGRVLGRRLLAACRSQRGDGYRDGHGSRVPQAPTGGLTVHHGLLNEPSTITASFCYYML
jgi:hypothetical protein